MLCGICSCPRYMYVAYGRRMDTLAREALHINFKEITTILRKTLLAFLLTCRSCLWCDYLRLYIPVRTGVKYKRAHGESCPID